MLAEHPVPGARAVAKSSRRDFAAAFRDHHRGSVRRRSGICLHPGDGGQHPTNCLPFRISQAMKLPIYMDNHATTPVDPRVFEAMRPYFTATFGNAASRNHSFGWEAEEAVEKARKQVATLIGATAKEIVFTSGATESNNLALKGVAGMYKKKGNHVITAITEHKAVIDPCKRLERDGFQVTFLPVDRFGQVS